MSYLDDWRTRLESSFRAFAATEGDPAISMKYGVLGGGVLWAVREDAASPALAEALSSLTGRPIEPLLSLIGQLGPDPTSAARLLSAAAVRDENVRVLMDLVALRFIDDYIRLGLLRRTEVNVAGGISAGNVVINSQQYIGGDLVVTRPRAWSRPTAPGPPAHFAGRTDELDRLEAYLAEGQSVTVTGVQGMGGIGKTSLVLQAASRVQGFGAVLWASLGPEPSVVNHLLGWARYGDDTFESGDSPLEVLTANVRSVLTQLVVEHCPGRVLVILDDVWEGASVSAARVLQQAAPAGATMLITSRSHRVTAQLRSTRFELEPLTTADALLMLRKLLAGHPEVSDVDLAELAVTVDHHPLALELAAGQVQLLERPADDIPGLIEKYREGVPAGSPFGQIDLELGEDREDNLEVVLAFSYDSLDDDDQTRFRALGVLAYGVAFDRDLCAALWSTTDVATGLDALRHRALLGIAPESGWYQQHALLRAYARGLLKADESRAAVVSRYCDHVVSTSGGFVTRPANEWGPLEPMLPHVEEVGCLLVEDMAATADPEPATAERSLRFALNVRHVLARRRELRHPEWLEMGLSLARRSRDLGRLSLFLCDLGTDELFRGHPRAALKRLAEASSTAERSHDRRQEAEVSTVLAEFHLSSDPQMAPEHLRRAIGLYQELGDDTGLVRALLMLARWHLLPDAPDRQRRAAEAVLHEATAVAERAGDADGEVEVLVQLGRLYDSLGRHGRALSVLEVGLQKAAGLGRSDLEAFLRLSAASAAASTGQLLEAEAHLRAAVPLFRSTGHGAGQATALRNLAQLCALREEREHALDLFVDALPLVRRVTMEFLDIDDDERETAHPYFWTEYESVVKLDLVEAFRATISEADPEKPSGWVADDFVYYLVRETVGACWARGAVAGAWAAALQHLEARLIVSGRTFASELAFVAALHSLVSGGAGDLAEDNVYRPYVEQLASRVQDPDLAAGGLLLSAEVAFEYAENTLVARLSEREQARSLTIDLRRQRRLSALWGDQPEHELYAALLLVLAGRPAALRPDHPYQEPFDWLLSRLAEYEVLPVDWLLQQVTADADAPRRSPAKLQGLTVAADEALVRGSADEVDLLRGLVALLSGEQAELPADHPFARALARARAAIEQRVPLTVPIPAAQVNRLADHVVAARTREPKAVDLVRDELGERAVAAEGARDPEAARFVGALRLLLDGHRPSVDAGRYQAAVVRAAASIEEADAVAPSVVGLPLEEVERLAGAATAAALPGDDAEPAVQLLHDLRSRWATRGSGWAPEVALVDDLLALAGDEELVARSDSPYHSVVEEVRATVALRRHILSGDEDLPPISDQQSEDLALRALTEDEDTFSAYFRGLLSGRSLIVEQLDSLLAGTVRACTVEPEGRDRWIARLEQLRSALASRTEQLGPDDAAAEAELLTSLVAVVDGSAPVLPLDRPYEAQLRGVTRAIAAYRAGEHPAPHQLSGSLIHDLTVVTGSVPAAPERRPEWQRMVAGLRSRNQELCFDDDTVAFLDALLVLLDGRPADLPLSNLYRPFLHIAWQIGSEAARSLTHDGQRS